MPFKTHSLGRTFFQSKGKKNKKHLPLVILHGGPGGTSSGQEAFFSLSKDRQVFIYDQIGGGKSSKIDKSLWKIQTFVKELEYLIEAWKLDEFILFGSSWGTTLALEYFLKEKKGKVRSLIFQSPMFSAKDWENDALKLINKLPKKTKEVIHACHKVGATDSKVYENAVMEYYLKYVLRNKTKLPELFSETSLANTELYEYMWGVSEFFPSGTLKNYNKVSQLKKINIPTLFLCGEYDEATPQTTRKYKNLVKNSSLEVLKNCSHCIIFENPQLLNKKISHFLSSNNL